MNAIRTTLRYLDPELMNDAGSSLASAVDRAGRYFVSNNIPQRVVILVTDGEDLDGKLLPTARRWAREGVKVCCIGVGTPTGGKVPLNRWNPGAGAAKNTFGQEVMSRLDESNLQRLAAATGGRYYRLGDRGEGLQRLRKEFLNPLAETAAREDLENYQEGYQAPLAVALLALVARVILAGDRARRVIPLPAIGAHLRTPRP
jgi:Ca-activated chloride channel family protein